MSDEHGSDFVDELMEFLLRNYYSMMIKRVKRFFPNKFDAEDIVTETIIVLLENKSAVAAHEAPIKWLQTTLTHRVKQNSRIAKRNSQYSVRRAQKNLNQNSPRRGTLPLFPAFFCKKLPLPLQ